MFAISHFGGVRSDAQVDPLEKRFEIGGQVSVLSISGPHAFDLADPTQPQRRTEASFGGRIGYNLKKYLALEGEINFFPGDFDELRSDFTGGRVLQGLFGAKVGIRKGRIGVFGKARPGFVTSLGAVVARFPNGNGPNPNDPFGFETIRSTQFTIDLGGVIEFYPSRRSIIRFDVGDTITRYPDIQFICFPAGTPCPEDVYTHRPQFNIGYSVRF